MYRTEYRILSSDTDAKRQLKLSRLYTLLQEASIAHTTALGMGREKTLDKGLLWIITLQQTRIAHMPLYDETVCIKSWPGRTMHLLFPRYYRIEDRKGNALIEASALWALMDKATRRAAFPEEYGVAIRGVHTGKEIPLPTAPKAPATEADGTFSVPYSYVDLNGHMNNTRFYDLAEDYDKIEEAFLAEFSGGSNLHAGLLAAKELLESDPAFEAEVEQKILEMKDSLVLASKKNKKDAAVSGAKSKAEQAAAETGAALAESAADSDENFEEFSPEE